MKRRSESFFGLHFDFHAGENTRDIGAEFDGETLGNILEKVKPDYVQCDTKGHPGISGYPTKVGAAAPDIRRDILKEWRAVTAAHGVALFAHHSGIWDEKQAELHPDWRIIKADGGTDGGKMSLFSPYAEEVLIPQLKEIALEYRLDGAWVDGECWALCEDYSERARRAWEAEFGCPVPLPGQEGYEKLRDYQRGKFLEYVRGYVDAVHAVAPDFQITSNWLNTVQVPENVCITDFISGDFEPVDSVESGFFNGRVIQNFRRPWDLMAWGFRMPLHDLKTAPQLCQEAASVVCLGGGFQLYHLQDPKGTVCDPEQADAWAEVAEFCRARESFCHNARPLPDAAVIFSREAFYRRSPLLFGPWGKYADDLKGLFFLLSDCGFSTEVLLPFRVEEADLSAYRVIAVSNLGEIEQPLREKLAEYAAGGGRLIVCGAETTELFAEELGLTGAERVKDAFFRVFTDGKNKAVGRGECAEVSAGAGTDVLENMALGYPEENRDEREWTYREVPSAVRRATGKGSVTGVTFNAGTLYLSARTAQLRAFMKKLTGEERGAEVTGSSYVYPALMEKGGKTYVHLLNVAGEHRAEIVKSYDEIPCLCGLTVRFGGKRPRRATLLPEGIPLRVEEAGGKFEVRIERLNIHAAVELEYERD